MKSPQRAIREALAHYGLTGSEADFVVAAIVNDGGNGLLIYGSQARGDAIATSDIDLLALRRSADVKTVRFERVSISSYSPQQLRSASRTLYGTHLIRDARILWDPNGQLSAILRSLEPADPQELLSRVRTYSSILNQPSAVAHENMVGLTRLARYLLRTAVYATAMAHGTPCFSVRELADRFNDPTLATILASDPSVTGKPSVEVLTDLKKRLISVVGRSSDRQWSSLAEVAITYWEDDRAMSAMAIRAMGPDAWDGFDYSELPKVVL